MSRAFHDPADFPFCAALEAHAAAIHAEFRAVAPALEDYVERKLYDTGWRVHTLWNLPHRDPGLASPASCPQTAALIERWLPGHGAAGFSVLEPGTVIRPHHGHPGPFLRCHLALEVPPGDAGLRVAGETRRWQAGRCLVFDDRLEHEAWNRTDGRRVVLLIDFRPGA